MANWISTTATPGAVNLALVIRAQVVGTSGAVRFYLSASDYVDITMGANETEAADALRRLVDPTDPSVYA